MKKVQLYVDDRKDEVIFNLIERLEEESNNTRGFVPDGIKERLKAFEMLCKKMDTNDPMEVVMKYIEAISSTGTVAQPSERESSAALEEDDPKTSPPKESMNKFLEQAKNGFNLL